MELTPAGAGIAAIAGVLALLALLLADAPLACIALVLILFLLSRLLLFRHACARLVGGLRVRRRLDGEITRQGRIVSVVVEVGIPEVPLRVGCTDLLPENACLVGGSHIAQNRRGQARIEYRMQVLAQGSWPFRGVSLSMGDAFFAHGCALTSPPFTLPVMTVFPAAEFAHTSAGSSEREIEQPFGVRSQTVHSFREFLPGDNPRFIDWKLTARHGRTFVREMHALAGAAPVVIIDAPHPLHGSEEERAQLLEEAVALVAGIHGAEGACTLLVCAGPNLVHSLVNEQELSTLLSAAGDAIRALPDIALFREESAHVLKERAERVMAIAARVEDAPSGEHLTRLAARLQAVAKAKEVPLFEMELYRLLAPFAGSEVHLFHAGRGDQSHIRCLRRLCAVLGCTLVERVPVVPGEGGVESTGAIVAEAGR